MPGITKPPVLKSLILCGRGGQKESEEAKGCSCELQNHEGKHKQMSKKEALAKKKKTALIWVPTSSICWQLKWATPADGLFPAVPSWSIKGGCFLQPCSSQDFATPENFCCNSLAAQAARAIYMLQGAPDGQPPRQSCSQNRVHTHTAPPGNSPHRRGLLWKLSTNRNFGGANPSAFQRWYQHLTNAWQPLPWEASQQADKVEGRAPFWPCKNLLVQVATDTAAMLRLAMAGSR